MGVTRRISSPSVAGRAEELQALRSVLDDVLAGGSACTVLAGEAGVGKTRLVQELSRTSAEVDVLVGGCVEVGRDVLPYAPLVEILHELGERDGTSALRALAGPTGDELARLLPALEESAGPPELTRASGSRLYAALRALVTGLAARRPLLLVVEDLHWSDPGTRELLGLLGRRLPARTLLLLTVRTDEAGEQRALAQFLTQLATAGAHRIELARLTREEQAHQLSGILGVPPCPSRLDRVYARAEGNPFFAEEIVALGEADDVPATVRDLLQSRLDSLPAATRRVVRAVAAAGRSIEHALLARAVDLDGPGLDDALRPAVDRHVLVPGAAVYRFRHALLHETVASTLLPGELARLHRRLAEVLTEEPGLAASTHGLAARVAHHWLAAGDRTRGRRVSYDAAREAEQTLAFDEALTHYERVLALPEQGQALPVPRYRLLWDAAEAAHLSGAAHRAAELVEQAIACVDPKQRHHHAYLHERLGRYLWMAADGKRALASYRHAVELVPTDPVSCWQAAIVSGHAQVLMLSGRFREARAEAERAIAMAAQVDDGRSTEGHARNNLGVSLVHLGEVERGIEELRTAARIAEEEYDDVDDIARAIVNLQSVLFDAGRFGEALAVARRGVAAVDQLGLQRRKGIWCRCDAAESLLVLGRCDEAETLLGEALALHPEGIDAVRVHGTRGALALRRGRLDDARGALEQTRRLGSDVVDGHLMLPVYRALLETMQWQGDVSSATALVDEARQRPHGDGDAPYLVPVLATAAGVAADAAAAARAGRRRGAARLATSLAADVVAAAEAALSQVPAVLPPTAAALAVARAELSRATGTHDADAWAGAAARWQELGDTYQAGYALLREAECHLADRRRGAAATRLTQARQAATQADAEHLLRAVAALRARARLPLDAAPRDTEELFGLSARERDVLALVAQGRTDRQIGAELFISHRTVERHVSNILAKLDARTRAEIAAIAHRDRLVPTG